MRKVLIFILFFVLNSTSALADDKEVLSQFFQITVKNYIEPVSVEKLAVLVLQELNSVDKDIMVADDAKRISVYKNAGVFKSYIKPSPNDNKQWVKLIEKIIKELKKISPDIKEKEYSLFDILLKGAAVKLDSGSKYYSEYDIEKEDTGRHFFARNMKDDILYIKLKDFNNEIAQNIEENIKDYTLGIILDLRGNKGGMLNEGIKVAKLFLDSGIVGSSREVRSQTSNFYMSEKGDIFDGRPIIILVDGNTASAAEVLASALQEQGRARIIGTNTFGKGTVQTVFPLKDNKYLALSTAYLYTPSGKKIDKQGIMPDICTSDLIKLNDNSPCPREDRENNVEDFDDAIDLINKSLDSN